MHTIYLCPSLLLIMKTILINQNLISKNKHLDGQALMFCLSFYNKIFFLYLLYTCEIFFCYFSKFINSIKSSRWHIKKLKYIQNTSLLAILVKYFLLMLSPVIIFCFECIQKFCNLDLITKIFWIYNYCKSYTIINRTYQIPVSKSPKSYQKYLKQLQNNAYPLIP